MTNNGILDLDHLMVSVFNSQRAGETFERMGFALTPRSQLPGMSNRLICFPSSHAGRNNFVEFLGFDDRSKAPPIMFDILGDREGPVSMVMASADARASEAALAAEGFEPQPSFQFKRDWVLPSGEVLSPEFIVCIPKPGLSPLTWNICQYLNPELYRRPEFVKHRNTAKAFTAAIAIADDPAAVAAHYERAWSARMTSRPDGSLAVSPGRVELRLYTPSGARDRFPSLTLSPLQRGVAYLGFAIAFDDLSVARQHLDAGGLLYQSDAAGGVWLLPAAAHGCLMVFEQNERGAAMS